MFTQTKPMFYNTSLTLKAFPTTPKWTKLTIEVPRFLFFLPRHITQQTTQVFVKYLTNLYVGCKPDLINRTDRNSNLKQSLRQPTSHWVIPCGKDKQQIVRGNIRRGKQPLLKALTIERYFRHVRFSLQPYHAGPHVYKYTHPMPVERGAQRRL